MDIHDSGLLPLVILGVHQCPGIGRPGDGIHGHFADVPLVHQIGQRIRILSVVRIELVEPVPQDEQILLEGGLLRG